MWSAIEKHKPQRLYLIADGPKNISEKCQCIEVRKFVEDNLSWNCNLIKIFSDLNLGCAKRIQSGLDKVFEDEEYAIILEDDTLPDPTFFSFCEQLLIRFKDNSNVFHISGCNFHPNAVDFSESYCFSSIVNIWGWATWKRAWNSYNLMMPSWQYVDKNNFLTKWCSTRSQKSEMKRLFDLHCNNNDPWTWDYQWVYNCWKNEGLSIMPAKNLVSNLGIGPNASNTKSEKNLELYPAEINSVLFPLKHPKVKRNNTFELTYQKSSQKSLIRVFFDRIKNCRNFFNLQTVRNIFNT